MIGAPTNNNRLVLTMRRDYYTKKKIIPTLTRLRLEVVQAGTVDPLTMQQSFNIWIHYNMAPKFCLMGTFLKNNLYRVFRLRGNFFFRKFPLRWHRKI